MGAAVPGTRARILCPGSRIMCEAIEYNPIWISRSCLLLREMRSYTVLGACCITVKERQLGKL